MAEQPRTLAAALRRPRYLVSAWPWRALAYVATTTPISGVLTIGVLLVGAPLYAAVSAVVRRGGDLSAPLLLFLTFASFVIMALAPLVSAVVALVERWRLGLVDERRLPQPPWRGLAARYTTAEAWRETAHTFWLGSVLPGLPWILLLIVALDAILIVSPWLARDADDVIVAWSIVDSPAEALPFALLGVLLVPVLGYLVGLAALLQSTVARWLLGPGGDGAALREVTRSRTRLVGAYETERRRIERDVHDGAQPRLTSLTLQLGLAKLDVPDDSPAARPLATAIDQAKGLMVLLRQIVQGIRPQSLTDLGLAGAVRELAAEATIPVTVVAELPRPVPELLETTAYYVVSEALGNVARHAGATAAQVRLTQADGNLVVEVTDDGRGGADPARGTGLTGLADRVGAVNGRLLLSSPVGGPTLVRVELPWPS
jgi:signal transduction histidine kinase